MKRRALNNSLLSWVGRTGSVLFAGQRKRRTEPVLPTLKGIGIAIGGLFVLAGCATVEPYQKGNLADYIMRSDRDELASVMASHIQFSREATTGGEGVGGGGCGCN